MGEVVQLRGSAPPHRRLSSRLDAKRWQLLLQACQELYYDPEMGSRRQSYVQTERKILTMLSRHFGSNQAPIVLEMILTSYEVYLEAGVWRHLRGFDSSELYREICYLLAVAHMKADISGVQEKYATLRRKVDNIWESLGR